MFSSKSLIVSGLTFRSLIHFEFIFVYGVRGIKFIHGDLSVNVIYLVSLREEVSMLKKINLQEKVK